ncbi:TPA: hypothetical protein N0F65_004491 [Lagenidium giganteum]|uniref:R3H domain-containing protein n=1 Tax=Lagenidium giganteum TaxID=4803 RepID=A0AAV2ZGZ1_9STRA|nr:TPA: hypothetical protein N0F65_004491 [Lagenidium giganteum]
MAEVNPIATTMNAGVLAESDAECSSLCGSELEMEMAWGEGPIAPLRMDATTSGRGEDGRSLSNGTGSARAKTPQKRANASPLAKSKRLINIHPLRTVPYLAKPNELPVGSRKQQRWFNDHHFGNKAATAGLEDLMEHMSIDVDWKSNFEKLGRDKELQAAFRKARVHPPPPSNHPKYRRNDDWNVAEEMFCRVDRRSRTLVLRSFKTLGPFIEAVEHVVLHFVQWRELPSEIELSESLTRVLAHPMELLRASEKDVRMCIPLVDSAFHRLIVHSVCQFYGVRSRTEANSRFNTKIMILRSPKKKFTEEELEKISFCEFVRATRLPKQANPEDTTLAHDEDELELQTKSSECSDGFCLMDFPEV